MEANDKMKIPGAKGKRALSPQQHTCACGQVGA